MKSLSIVVFLALLAMLLGCQSQSRERPGDGKRTAGADASNVEPAKPEEQFAVKATPDVLLRELRLREARANKEAFATTELPAAVGPLKSVQGESLLQLYLERTKSIYGPDDRKDLFMLSSALPAERDVLETADSVVALLESQNVRDNNDGTSTLVTQNFGARYGLCDSERFREQPTGAFCSGALIGPRLVLTAGHCVGNARFPIERLRVVFGYRMRDAAHAILQINNRDIYKVVEVVGRSETGTSDWGIVRLDRDVVGHQPLAVARFPVDDPDPRKRKIADNEPVFAIGHPCGLPAKYAPNATVQGNGQSAFFVTNLDTYGGNSGSPVFASRNGRHEIVGVLVRGLDDFKDFVSGGTTCRVSLRYRDDEAGEASTRTSEFINLLPQP